jgi:hypothetical protein
LKKLFKMKTLKNQTFFLFALFLFFSHAGYSQQETSILGKLKSTIWNALDVRDGTYDLQFTDSTMVWTFGKSKEYIIIEEFFLSNSAETEFKSNQVGKNLNGNFLVFRAKRTTEDKRPKPISVMEIIELTNEKLLFKLPDNPGRPYLEFQAKNE